MAGSRVGWVERSDTHQHRRMTLMGFAEFIIGPAEGRTRWLHPSYGP